MNEWILLDAYLAFPTDFAEADDIITNLAKDRELGIEIIKIMHSLILTYNNFPYLLLVIVHLQMYVTYSYLPNV